MCNKVDSSFSIDVVLSITSRAYKAFPSFRSLRDLTTERKSSFDLAVGSQTRAKANIGIFKAKLSVDINAKYNTKKDKKYRTIADERGELLVSKVWNITKSIDSFLN